MLLTDVFVRNAKPKDKPYRLFDGSGLYIEVTPSGGKYWRLKYRFDAKEKRLSFGVYPEVTLKEARDRRDESRRLLRSGVDPRETQKAEQSARADADTNSFEVIAREWFSKHSAVWAKGHSSKVIGRLERDVFPFLGSEAISTITAPKLLGVLRRVELRGAIESAHRILQVCSQIFRYAVATGRAERDPTTDLKGALPPSRERHHASITEPKAVGELLRAIDGYRGSETTKCALRLAPLLFVRPGAWSAGRYTRR